MTQTTIAAYFESWHREGPNGAREEEHRVQHKIKTTQGRQGLGKGQGAG